MPITHQISFSSTMKITALTSFCVDIYPELGKVYVGGNSLNFAVQCKLSGIEDVSIIGAVGDDPHGRLLEHHLEKCRIPREHLYRIKGQDTASNKIFIDEKGDRYFKSDSWNGGTFDAFRLSDIDWKLLEESDVIAMPGGDPNLKELLKRRKDQLIIVDFLDYLPLSFVEQNIEFIDIVFISAKEDMLDSLNSLAMRSKKMIVSTLGEKGSIAYCNGNSYFQGAIKADEIVDTTGCGDAFQAAFAIEWYSFGDIAKALKQGALAAKNVLGFAGGVQQ